MRVPEPRVPGWPRWVAVLALLAGSGVVQGRLSGRWSPSSGLEAALARLDTLPREVGTWKGEDLPIDRPALDRAGILGGVQRRYRDGRTGSSVQVLLVCGRPGPISVHTPDVCYEGAGYELAAPPSGPIPGFWAAKMVRPGEAITDALQVFWSWNASGRWEAPANPRLVFAARPYLYKLYIVRSTAEVGGRLDSGPGVEFAGALAGSFALDSEAARPGPSTPPAR